MITLKLKKDKSSRVGIEVYEADILIGSFDDVSKNEADVIKFIDLCNSSDVDAIHLSDLLEDFF